MSIRLGISVEGQTEERFVKVLLAPHLSTFDVHVTPVIVATSRSADGTKAKGGGINLDRVESEVSRLLRGFADGYVTTLYDFYGFADRPPGESVAQLEIRIAARLRHPKRFISYVQLHEFEGLLLADSAIAAEYFEADAIVAMIDAAVARAGSPEMIDDGPLTAPSKRLEAWTRDHSPTLRRYSKATKTLHGPQLAARLTLPVIRRACPRFDRWVARLEKLRA